MSGGPNLTSGLADSLRSATSSSTLLKVADRVTGGMYVVPAGHRFRTLAFSLGFSLAGNSIMQVLNGEDGKGHQIKKEDVVFFLRPLHGLLEHNKHSDDPEDRWKEVAGRALPILGAAVGAYVGSYNWAATSPGGSANMDSAKETAAILAGKGSITASQASIYVDAERGNASRIIGGILQSLGLHSGIHQLFVPSVINLGVGLGGAFLGANNRVLNAAGTEGLKKSTSEMADHLGRNTYNKVLSQLAKEEPQAARDFLTKVLTVKGAAPSAEMVEKALERIYAGSGIDLIENFANKSLNRYLARAAVDYRKSIANVSTALAADQNSVIAGLTQKKDGISPLQVWIDQMKSGKKPEEVVKDIEKAGAEVAQAAFGPNFLKTIRAAGFDEKKIEIGESNWVYRVFEWLIPGSKTKAETRLQESFAQTATAQSLPAADLVSNVKGIGPDLGAKLLGGAAALSVAGMVAAKPKTTPDLFAGYRERAKERSFKGFLNKHVLPKFEFVTRMSIADPSWGRFWLAGGFTLGLVGGDYLMQLPFGRSVNPTIAGDLLNKLPTLPTPSFMNKFKGSLAYDPLSGTDRDRWLKTANVMAVMAFGALGTFLGARWATKDRRQKLMSKDPVYLDDFEDRVTFAQGKAWEIPTAIASTPGSALGTTHFGLIPGVNYGANIANYHLLSNGGKIAWQGPGKVLMGSQSRYRFGPVKLIDHMIQYAAYNPDELPKQLTEMAAGIVLPWFPDATPLQVNAFAAELIKIRNAHWQQGGIAAEKKEGLIKEMTEHFRGAGLEKMLIEIGLNPAEAKLGNNGLIGQVSEVFGARGETKKLNLDFLKSLENRHPEQCQARRDRVATGKAQSPTTAILAADALTQTDRNGGSFASRLSSRDSAQNIVTARTGQTALQRTEASRESAALAL